MLKSAQIILLGWKCRKYVFILNRKDYAREKMLSEDRSDYWKNIFSDSVVAKKICKFGLQINKKTKISEILEVFFSILIINSRKLILNQANTVLSLVINSSGCPKIYLISNFKFVRLLFV